MLNILIYLTGGLKIKIYRLLFVTLIIFTACKSASKTEYDLLLNEVSALREENANLKNQITELNEAKELAEINLEQMKEKKIEEIKNVEPVAKEILKDSVQKVDSFGDFAIVGVKLSKTIIPPNAKETTGIRYYKAEDSSNEIYLDIIIDFKNISDTTIYAENITTINCNYDNNNYASLSCVEIEDGENFSDTFDILPTKIARIHNLIKVPVQISNDKKPIILEFSIRDVKYKMNLR